MHKETDLGLNRLFSRNRYDKIVPLVDAWILDPPLKAKSELNVSFLVDSGSAYTILSPTDSYALGLSECKADYLLRGFNGVATISCKKIRVGIWIQLPTANGNIEWCGKTADIYANLGAVPNWWKQPSILGRDMLQHFDLSIRRQRAPDEWVVKLSTAANSTREFLFWNDIDDLGKLSDPTTTDAGKADRAQIPSPG